MDRSDRSVKVKITQVRRSSIKAQGSVVRATCPTCQREVEMIATVEAIAILKVSELAFDDLLTGGVVHAIQTVSGSLWVCKDSLFENKLASARSG
jgi:hypothetical protein